VLLLDTHVWYWLIDGSPRLPGGTQRTIDRAAARGELLVSVMSTWEIAMLEAKARVTFDIPCLDWIRRALAPPLRLAPITPEVAVESTRLPEPFHRDPVDRLLTATARVDGLTLMTRDRRILDYAAKGHVRALAC
jgi:PIN domain nuclease of toxin-antitoxin system